MILTNKWQKDDLDRMLSYNIDLVYKRRIISLGANLSLIESIRVTQLNIDEHINVLYFRGIGMSESKMFSRVYLKIYNVLSSLLNREKDEVISDITDSKLYIKYPFIGDEFKSVIRDRKLKQLGIG